MPTLQVSGGKKNCSFPNRNTRARSSHFQFDSFSVAVDNCQLCLNSFESFRKEGRKRGLCGARSARESFVTDSPLYKYAPCNPTSLKAPWNSFLTKRTTALINIPTTTTLLLLLMGLSSFFSPLLFICEVVRLLRAQSSDIVPHQRERKKVRTNSQSNESPGPLQSAEQRERESASNLIRSFFLYIYIFAANGSGRQTRVVKTAAAALFDDGS